MPTYEYLCEICKDSFETVQSIKEPNLEDCPKCKTKESLSRVISAVNFQLNGSDWPSKAFKNESK